ncbi:MAG: ABC transporter permease [Clostridiales bacterium]|nr:ABC transporter permease [Clostridiales bacterium]
MRKLFFYPHLAAQNIKTNRKLYVPFLITSTLSAAMFFIIYSLSVSKSLASTFAGKDVTMIMSMAMIIAVIFFAVFLLYTQSFLIKRRKKEFGLYSVLGMEKKHICITCFFETLYVALISTVGGIAFGALMTKLVYMALLKLLSFDSGLEFEFSFSAVIATALIFTAIFVVLFINTARSIVRKSAVELLTGGNVGEKEPKTKWLTTIIGIASLAAGYAIALNAENPLDAITMFIIAVILVMIGTYCLFSAGSIALLKLLRKNKNYYYKTKHFVSVSGMMYRMKQNAVGLGNICILCTAVLIMVSTTASMYGGMEELLRTRYPRNLSVMAIADDNAVREHVDEVVDRVVSDSGIETKNVIKTAERSMISVQEGTYFSGRPEGQEDGMVVANNVTNIICVVLDDYNRIVGSNETLGENEAILCVVRGSFKGDTMHFGNYDVKVKSQKDSYEMAGRNLSYIVNSFYVIVPDDATVAKIYKQLGGERENCRLTYEYSFDTDAASEAQVKLFKELKTAFEGEDFKGKGYTQEISVESAEVSRTGFFSLYGGLLFIGIFLGLVFMTATVLIIYYKQVSEGYDDKERYAIMQKVGMDAQEIKKSIHSQVLTVFFLPLITAFIHLAFAFPIITELLALLNLTQISIFVTGLIITAAVFSVIYALVYLVTAKAYYKIVSDK